MPRLSEQARLERRTHIAEAAVRALARKGIAGTSMADIIGEAGLSAGSVYSHFDSKAQLLRFTARAMIEVRGTEMSKVFATRKTPPHPQEVLRFIVMDVMPVDLGQVLVSIFAEAATDPELLEVVDEALVGVRAMIASLVAAWAGTAAGRGRFVDADATEVAARAANAIMVNAHGLLVRRTIAPGTDIDALIEDLMVGWE